MKHFSILALLAVLAVCHGADVTVDPSEPLNLGGSTWKQTEWNTDGNLEGWSTAGTSATVGGGVLAGTTNSTVPQLTIAAISGGPDLDLAFNDYLDIRLKVPATFAGDVVVFYGAANTGTSANMTGFAASRTLTIPNAMIAKDGATHLYRVDTSLLPWWRGTLSGLRLQLGSTSGVAWEIDYLRVGDTGVVPTIKDLDAACNRMVSSKHFVFGWSDAPGAMGQSLTDARVRSNLRDAEECWAFYYRQLAYPRPRWTASGGPYKINFVSMEGGYHAGGGTGSTSTRAG